MTVSNSYPFSPIVRIYPGGQPADASTWGVGTDISASVRYPSSEGGQPITYSGGRPDEAASADPGEMSLTLDNRSGDFSTENPYSPYYGQLRRGTPIQLSMVSGVDTFNRTAVPSGGWGTSTSGQVWTPSGGASRWSTSGTEGLWTVEAANIASQQLLTGGQARNADLRYTCRVPAVATGAPFVIAGVMRRVDGSNYLYFKCQFGLLGVVTALIARAGGAGDLDLDSSVLGFTYAADDKLRVRTQTDGADLRIKVWKPANPAAPDADEPDAWSATAQDSSITGVTNGVGFWRVAGNTNAGSIAMAMDDIVLEAAEWTGNVIKWPVRWDKSGNNCWAPITAAGPLRRLRQGTGVLKSPLARQLASYSPTGYWPLEDGPQAGAFGSAVTGVGPAPKTSTVTPAADTTLPGALQSPTFANATASIRGSTPLRQTGAGFSAMFLCKLSALPGSKTKIASFKGSGRIITWNIYIDGSSNITTEGVETDGTLTVNVFSTMASVDPTEWTAYQIETEFAGGTITWAMIFHQVGSTTFFSHSSTYSTSVPSRAFWFQLGSGSSDLDGAAFAHVWIGEDTLPFVDETFQLVSSGYAGELASDRIARLCAESGVPVVVEPGTSAALGPQPRNDFLDAVVSAADADMGLLYEAGNGLGFRPLSARYDQDVTFALSVAAGEIDDPPEPVLDDQRVRNDWTVNRDGGSFAQVEDPDHIAAEGRWEDSATINVQTDDVLVGNAQWRTYLGTRPGWRWPGMQLNFARSPQLIEAWRSRPFAPRMTVTTGLDQAAGADPDVIVEGWNAELWPHGWTVDLSCSDATSYDVGVYDTGRYDSASTTLASGVNAAATSLSFSTTDLGDIWSTTAEPYDVVISGEVVTVTSMGAASGSGPYTQTATVTRAVNGISKSLPAGAEIHLAVPTRYAL